MDASPEPVDTSSTRQFDTLFGEKSYAEVSDLIAEPLRQLLDDVASGTFASSAMDVDLIRGFHLRILTDVMPDIAGRWRQKPVRVGSHYPPEHIHVDREMRELLDTFGARLQYSNDDITLQLEALHTWKPTLCMCTRSKTSTVERCGSWSQKLCGVSISQYSN